jgi:hypothetical protein
MTRNPNFIGVVQLEVSRSWALTPAFGHMHINPGDRRMKVKTFSVGRRSAYNLFSHLTYVNNILKQKVLSTATVPNLFHDAPRVAGFNAGLYTTLGRA